MTKTSLDKKKDFITTLNDRVDVYMSSSKSIFPQIAIYIKALFFVCSYAFVYYQMLWGGVSFGGWLGLVVVFALIQVSIIMNIGHDAIHGAFPGPKWMNYVMQFFVDLAGGNAYVLKNTHRAAHAKKELIIYGGNLEQQALVMRFSKKPTSTFEAIVRKIMLPFTYMFYSSYLFNRDFDYFYKNDNPGSEYVQPPWYEHVRLWFFKLLYMVLVFAMPFFVLDFHPILICLGFVVMWAMISLLMIIALLMPEGIKDVPQQEVGETKENYWARIILKGNTDYDAKNQLLLFFLGGGNINVVHKFFPHITHTHYLNIVDIIKETTKEFELEYQHGSALDALRLHFTFVRGLSNNNDAAIKK